MNDSHLQVPINALFFARLAGKLSIAATAASFESRNEAATGLKSVADAISKTLLELGQEREEEKQLDVRRPGKTVLKGATVGQLVRELMRLDPNLKVGSCDPRGNEKAEVVVNLFSYAPGDERVEVRGAACEELHR